MKGGIYMPKKILCIFLSLICMLGTISSAAAVTETDVPRMGDVNFDDRIDAADALWVLKYAVKKMDFTPEQLAVADVSYYFHPTEEHKGIDTKDALIILLMSIPKYPHPVPQYFGRK